MVCCSVQDNPQALVNGFISHTGKKDLHVYGLICLDFAYHEIFHAKVCISSKCRVNLQKL